MFFQKLIAYDHLEGDPGLDSGKNVPLFTEILNMACNCIDNFSPDRYGYSALVFFFHVPFVCPAYSLLINNLQYHFARTEGTSHCSSINQI